MTKRIVSVTLLIAMLATLCVGCGKKETPSRRDTNEIVVGIAQDLENSLDPHTAVAAGSKEVLFNIFEGLVKPTDEGELDPAVADEVTVSPDGLTYAFHLREGVKFHNGDTVEMEDVLYSINRCWELGVLPAYDETIADCYADGDTLYLVLRQSDAEFLSYMTFAILPADYTEQATAPVGTGPFRFVSRIAQQNLVLERFADYWGEGAKLDRVTYQIYENAEALVMALRSGAVDVCAHLTATQVSQLDGFEILEGTMNLVQAVYLNHAYAPLADERVRQALCYALDRQAIFDIVAGGHGAPVGSSMYPAFKKYFNEDLNDLYPTNVEKAKALLAEAGYADGFTLKIAVPSNYQPHVDTAQVVAEQFRAIGVTVEIEPVTWPAWLEDVYTGRNYQATVIGVDASTMTASAMLSRFVSTAGNNFINFNNADYDAAFASATSAATEDEQTEAYLECEEILAKTAANVYIQDMADLVAVRNGLDGYEFYPLYVIDLSTIHYD